MRSARDRSWLSSELYAPRSTARARFRCGAACWNSATTRARR